MTDRIYYSDPQCRAFEGVVTRLFEHDGRPAIVLDRSAFYPTSGGQPFDTGSLGGVRVLETLDLDGDVVHVVSGPIEAGTRVAGEVDWARRFDHMQQHTGQHVLSAAFERLFENRTTSFHMGAVVSTIDLALDATASDVERAVEESNAIVWDDRPISIRFASPEEAARLPLRKEPTREGPLRLIEIPDFDLSACGGTHVARTGSIGLIAALSTERIRGGARVTFACGGRALRALRTYRDAVTGIIRLVSVTPDELPAAVERLQTDGRQLRKEINGLQEALAAHDAATLIAGAETTGSVRLFVSVLDGRTPAVLKTMALAAAKLGDVCVALLTDAPPVSVVIARSASVGVDAAAVLRGVLEQFGGRGGGKSDLAQAGGLSGSPQEIASGVREALRKALDVRVPLP